MDVIFKMMIQIWLCQKCVPVPHNIIGYHTENVYYDVARNSLILVYLVWIQINMEKTHVQQYILMFTTMYHAVPLMEYDRMNNEQHVLCVPLNLVL